MEEPLWIDRHRPSLNELPQRDVSRYLHEVPDGPVNLLLHGPAGVGKTAAVHALADELHAEPETDLLSINVDDFFRLSKRELANDSRFERFISSGQRRDSKAALINHVLTEMASYPPVSGSFKTVLLDNAEAMREDFQQALRRVMERHYEATQFVLTTRRQGAIIDPIRSRCALVPVPSPTTAQTVTVLERIATAEGVEYTDDGLHYIAEYAAGNLREAILAAQATAVEGESITMEAAYAALEAVGPDEKVANLLEAAEKGAFSDARDLVDDLLYDRGYSGEEILEDILRVSHRRYEAERAARIAELAGEIEFDLGRGTNDRVHLAHLLARLGETEPVTP